MAPSLDPGAAGSGPRVRHQPLAIDHYTADPSGHVFEGRLYVYASHDVPGDVPEDLEGNHFDMRDYHVYSLGDPDGEVTDHGVALRLEDVPWAGRQLWAPDATEKDGTYYFFFPARDHDDVFRIGVATAARPAGPFTAEPEPIEGAFSIDPAVLRDDDGEYYLYFGGIWGGQLQRWATGEYVPHDVYPAADEPALLPKVARLGPDLKSLAEAPRGVELLTPEGEPVVEGDTSRRFFEGAWVFRRGGLYYFMYSTGETTLLAYATGTSPYGPFTHRGTVLKPVTGWTTQGSVFEYANQWYLLYHDSHLSGEVKLRNTKLTPLEFEADGSIVPVDPML